MIAGFPSEILAGIPQTLETVLKTQLNLPSNRIGENDLPAHAIHEECFQASVRLCGATANGIVRLQIPDSFAAKAAMILFGEQSNHGDIAGELCNMTAGLIAAKITDEGGPFTLETPTVSCSVRRTMDPDGRLSLAHWECEENWLTLEVQLNRTEHAP